MDAGLAPACALARADLLWPDVHADITVRAKIRPLLEWAAARNVAVLGIIHPLKQGSQDVFAGCDAFRRAARAAWRCVIDPADDEPLEKRKRRLIIAAKVNNAPDDLRLAYRIEGVELPGGIASSRVVFQPVGRPMREAPAARATRQSSRPQLERPVFQYRRCTAPPQALASGVSL